MTPAAFEPGRNALMLNELRQPTIGRLWPDFAGRSDRGGWPRAASWVGGWSTMWPSGRSAASSAAAWSRAWM